MKRKKHINPNCQCASCKTKRGNSPRYIDGRSLKKYYCKDCGKKINWQTAIYGQNRCNSCEAKKKY